MKRNILLVGALAVLSLTGCKTTKSLVNKEVSKTNAVEQVIGEVQKTQPAFITANVSKMSLDLSMGGRRLSVSGSCRIRKDSALFLSIQTFGFEVMKAELMPDSIRVFDKMNRRYYISDYAFLGRQFGVDVDFYSIQSLLTAQFFCVGQKEPKPDSCRIVLLPEGGKKIEFTAPHISQTTRLSAKNIIEEVLLKPIGSNYRLQTAYSAYSKVDDIQFPRKINLLASNDKTEGTCNFEIYKVEFNTPLKFIPTERNKFIRGDIDQFFKK